MKTKHIECRKSRGKAFSHIIAAQKKVFLFCAMVLVFFPLTAISMEEAEALLQQAQENTAFAETDFGAAYSVVQEKPGEGRSVTEAVMYRRDSEGKYVILVTNPPKERGKGYLQENDVIWFYDPVDGRFTFTSAKDKFQNSNANNSDFVPQYYHRDYSIETAEEAKLGKMDCVYFVLKAKTDKVDYPELHLWITVEDGLVRKKEDYSMSGKKLRTMAIPSYQYLKTETRTYYVPVKMLIIDELRGKTISRKFQNERTEITISNISFEKQDSSIYTKAYLEMMSNK